MSVVLALGGSSPNSIFLSCEIFDPPPPLFCSFSICAFWPFFVWSSVCPTCSILLRKFKKLGGTRIPPYIQGHFGGNVVLFFAQYPSPFRFDSSLCLVLDVDLVALNLHHLLLVDALAVVQ